MELRFAVWTSFFVDLSPEEALRELAQAGWHHAELSDEHSRVLLGRGVPSQAGGRFRRASQDAGVAVTQGHLDLPIDIAPADETARRAAVENLKRWLDLYQAIGIAAAVLHPGGASHTDPAARTDEQLRSLAQLTDHVRGTALSLCLENCSAGDALMPLLAQTDPAHVGVCLDTGHLNLTDENQADFIQACGPRLRALHLAENDTTADQHNLPYARGGSVPWPQIATALAAIPYRGLLNFEIPGENRCPLAVRRLKLAYLTDLAAWIFHAPAHAEPARPGARGPC